MKIVKSRLKDKDFQAVPAALSRAAKFAKKLAKFYGTEFVTAESEEKKSKKKSQTKQ
jgi:hypothetical protein